MSDTWEVKGRFEDMGEDDRNWAVEDDTRENTFAVEECGTFCLGCILDAWSWKLCPCAVTVRWDACPEDVSIPSSIPVVLTFPNRDGDNATVEVNRIFPGREGEYELTVGIFSAETVENNCTVKFTLETSELETKESLFIFWLAPEIPSKEKHSRQLRLTQLSRIILYMYHRISQVT